MPGSYSYDLRIRVMNQLEQGVAVTAISKIFAIHRDTIYEWKKLKAATGDVKAKTHYQQGHSHKVTDWQHFKAFVQHHGGKTLLEMANAWQVPISATTLGRALKKAGCTRKKRLIVIEREKKICEKRLKTT
jgi:transposase